MNSPSSLQRRLAARFARPQRLFLTGREALADWLAAHPGTALELVVSARLSHELVCEPGLPLADDAALQAYARQLFGHYFGAAAKGWPLAAWFSGAQKGATALHGVDGVALRQLAAEQDVELRRVQPAWAPLLHRLAVEEPDWLRAPTAALAWVEGQVLTWLLLVDGQLQSLRQVRLPAATQAALGETVAELRSSNEAVLLLGYGLDAGATPVWPGVRVLSTLDGEAPELGWFDVPAEAPKTLPQPDFLGPRLQRSRLAWPLAATGLLVLAMAAAGLQDSRQALAEARERNDSLSAAVSREPRAPAVVAAGRAPSARTAELEQLRSAAEVQALLQQGWEPMLSNVEQAGSAQLSWLGLDYSAGRNELRLDGLTQDKGAALQLVDRLAAAPGWHNVVLSRFQTGEQGLSGQRFELSARLRSDLLKPELAPVKDKKP